MKRGANASARLGRSATRAARAMESYRAASSWLKPLWLEGMGATETLRNTYGIQPLNTPMRQKMWDEYQALQRSHGFKWGTMPLERFGNGPVIADQWHSTFRRHGFGGDESGLWSVHANCGLKDILTTERHSMSFLLHPSLA